MIKQRISNEWTCIHTHIHIYIESFCLFAVKFDCFEYSFEKKKGKFTDRASDNIKEDYKWELIKIKEKKNRKVYDPRGIFYSPARNDVISPTIYATFDR